MLRPVFGRLLFGFECYTGKPPGARPKRQLSIDEFGNQRDASVVRRAANDSFRKRGTNEVKVVDKS